MHFHSVTVWFHLSEKCSCSHYWTKIFAGIVSVLIHTGRLLCHPCSINTEIPTCSAPLKGLKCWNEIAQPIRVSLLIEADKNTNCTLLNCWHWTGWIRPSINNRWRAGGKTGASRKWRVGLQTTRELRLEHRQGKNYSSYSQRETKKTLKLLNRSMVLYSCWLLQSQIYTLLSRIQSKKSKTISLTSWK